LDAVGSCQFLHSRDEVDVLDLLHELEHIARSATPEAAIAAHLVAYVERP